MVRSTKLFSTTLKLVKKRGGERRDRGGKEKKRGRGKKRRRRKGRGKEEIKE